MTLALTRSSAPSEEPITLEDAKLAARVVSDAEDQLVQEYITGARDRVERFTSRALISQTLVARFDSWSDPEICDGDGVLIVPRPPLQSVTSIQYVDTDGDTQTLDTDVYQADLYSHPGRIYLKPDQSWPDLYDQRHAVTLTYVAGYGDEPSDLPPGLRQAVRFLFVHYYDIRAPIELGTIATAVPEGIRSLLENYRIWEKD